MPRSLEAVLLRPPPAPPPNRFLKKSSTRLDAPLRLPFADRHRIADLHARALERLEHAQAFELFLQVIDAFLAVQVCHGDDALDALSAHTVQAARARLDAKACFFFGRQ